MSRVKRYLELLGITRRNINTIVREYKGSRFHPYYLNELLNGRYLSMNPTLTTSTELGDKNKHKTIALIILDRYWAPTAGFFALLNRTLCALYYADKMGYIPVVSNWDGCAYEEKNKINNTNIVFEYYFEPAGDCSIKDAFQSNNVIVPSNNNMDIILHEYNSEWYNLSKDYLHAMGEIYKKYVRLNSETKKRMLIDIKSTIGNKKTLGIHFRGSDYRVNANGHPISLTLDDYYFYIDKAMKEYDFEQIFVATDDLKALEKLKEKYDCITYYKDVKRTEGDVSVAFLKDNRKNHKFNLGYEVLRDAYSLASCSGLIAGHSQVAVGARIMKESFDESYDYCKIIEKGINHNKKEWVDIYYQTIDNKENE